MDVPVLTIAIILQFAAAVLAFRLVRLSRGWVAWTLIAAAVFLITVRLAVTLVQDAMGQGHHYYGLEEHFLSLAVAILLLAGMYAIRPLFLAFRRAEDELRRALASEQAAHAALTAAQAEAERQAAAADERRRLLEAVMEQLPEGVIVADAPDLRFRLVSRYCQRVTGMSAADLVGKTLAEHGFSSNLLHLDGTAAAIDDLPLARAVRSGETIHGEEWLLRRADGRILTCLVNAAPIRDRGGTIVGGVTVWLDISERKQDEVERERLLEENRQRVAELEAIFAASADGIAIYGPNGEILRLNAAAEELLGFTPEERALDLERRFELLRVERMDGTPLPPAEIPGRRALAGEKVRAILHLSPPRRPARWFSVSAAPIRPVGSSAAAAVTILTDITDFHTLQEEQEVFMQMISHDLRTPITVIQGHAEMLEGRLAAKDELTAVNVEAILAASRHLTGMMEDLARMIHLERGQLPLDLEPIAVADFVARLVHRLAVPGLATNVEVAIPSELPPVWADPGSLERVLTNLITNAFKYSPPDTPVQVAAAVVGDELQISVRDRGPGIAREDQPYLFERFFRARDAGRKRGIGLGLYITRKLVEAHGGRVWVESTPGEGSVFTFSLPLRRQPPPAADAGAPF